ncbi:MAG: hypothetical protein R3F62_01875 [Planctomycetota bacterium]
MRWTLRRRRWGAMGIGCGLASWGSVAAAVWYANHMIAPPGMVIVGALFALGGVFAAAGALFGALGLARPPRTPGALGLGLSGSALLAVACFLLGG